MSELNQTAKEVVTCLGPLISGGILGVILPCGQPQVDEVSLAKRGEIQYPVTLSLPTAPTALAEPAPEARSENPVRDGGHATSKGEGNEKDCHTSREDTSNFREGALDQNDNAEDESNTSSYDTSRVVVVGQDDVGGQEAAAATASNKGVPVSERLWISDFAVSGTGASFDDGAFEALPAEAEYAQLLEDLVDIEKPSNTQDEARPNQQLDHVTVDDDSDDEIA